MNETRKSPSNRVPEAQGVSPLGPSSQLVWVEADPDGRIIFRTETSPPRILVVGREFGARRHALIETIRATWIFDPASNALRALCYHQAGQTRIFFFGPLWGTWMDERGQRCSTNDPLGLMKAAKVPATFDPKSGALAAEFNITTQFRESFSEDARLSFQGGGEIQHQVALTFETPTGKFQRAQLFFTDRKSHGGGWSLGLRGFPLVWPEPSAGENHQTAPQAKSPSRTPSGFYDAPGSTVNSRPPIQRQAENVDSSDGSRLKLKPRNPSSAEAPLRNAPPPEPTREEVVPIRMKLRPATAAPSQVSPLSNENRRSAEETAPRLKLRPASPREESSPRLTLKPSPMGSVKSPTPPEAGAPKKGHLTTPIQQIPIQEAVEKIAAERDVEEQWRMIEANLMLGRSERAFPLIAEHGDLIGGKAQAWPAARLKVALGYLPGTLLLDLMNGWSVNQIMAVAEENPEAEKIMDWLRERELGRLLTLSLKDEPVNGEEARQILGVDRRADPQAVKKVWRTLLGFINADHGRQSEQAIHRKKDEIAKHLQSARNILIRMS